MPVSRLWGAGPKLQAKLLKAGFETIGDIAAADERVLAARLGAIGERLHALAHAHDPRTVARYRAAKSIGCDRTLEVDVSRRQDICVHLNRAADTLGRRLRRKGYVARGVRLKLKTTDFRLLTRQRTLPEPTDVAATLYRNVVPLVDQLLPEAPFRLVGLAAYDLARVTVTQPDLFDTDAPRRRLEAAIDALSARFGPDVVHRAADLAERHPLRLAPNLDFLDGDEDDEA
jgi:DNA polymerase-4